MKVIYDIPQISSSLPPARHGGGRLVVFQDGEEYGWRVFDHGETVGYEPPERYKDASYALADALCYNGGFTPTTAIPQAAEELRLHARFSRGAVSADVVLENVDVIEHALHPAAFETGRGIYSWALDVEHGSHPDDE